MATRIYDALFLDLLSQHPDVAPHVRRPETAALVRNIADHRNVILCYSCALGIFEWSAPGAFEGHFMSAPPTRGREAINAGREMLRQMFCQYGAKMIQGHVLLANKRMRWFSRQIGMTSLGIKSGHEIFAIEGAA